MPEIRSFGIDSNRTRRLQDTARKINTRYNTPEDFVDDAVGYFVNMWQTPEFTYADFIGYTKHMSENERQVFKAYGGKIKKDIEEQEKTINDLEDIGKFQSVENTEFHFPVEPSLDEEIQRLFNKNPKLKDYLHGGHTKAFVNEAIDIFILMWSDTEKFQIKLYKIYELLPKEIIEHWKDNFQEEFEIFVKQYDTYKELYQNGKPEKKSKADSNTEEEKNIKKDNFIEKKDFKKTIEKGILIKSDSFLPKKKQAFISQFHGRIFPIKLITRILAEMIYENKGKIIDYNIFSEKCYKDALTISKNLKRIEEEKNIKRNKKFSTGLPVTEEDEISKKRFVEQYVGITERTWKNRQRNYHDSTFDGALNSFGFAYFLSEKENERSNEVPRIKVGITKKGLKFAMMKNDIIDDFRALELNKDNWKNPLTEKESTFIQKNIFQDFPFEELLIQNLMKDIKKTQNRPQCEECDTTEYSCSHVIDKKFHEWTKDLLSKHDLRRESFKDIEFLLKNDSDKDQEKKKQTLQQLRTATIGRLSELGMIEWRISTKENESFKKPGTSYYTIPKQ